MAAKNDTQFADLELSEAEQKALAGEEVSDAHAGSAGSGDSAAASEAADPGTTQPEIQDQSGGRPRDPEGRFAKAEEGDGKVVPLATMLEERKERQRLQKELDDAKREQRQRNAILEARLQEIRERFAKPKEAEAEPTPLDTLKRTTAEVEQLKQRLQQQDQIQRFSMTVEAQARQFAEQQPDYVQRYQFVRGARASQLKAQGWDDGAIEQQLAQDELQLAADAVQRGKNPAAVISDIAQAWGYKPPVAQTSTGANQTKTSPNGGDSTGARLDTIARGQAAAASLSGSGAAPSQKLDLEALAQMSEAQFAALTEDQWASIMRG